MANENKRVIEQTASSEIYNDDWFLKDSVLEGTTKISKDNLIDKIGASKINSIAEDYDSTSTYNKDDFAFYENKLYRCLANNTTGTWDSTKWEEFDLPTALITTAHNIETAEFTIGTYYSADDLVLKDGKLYQCVVGHNATEWKSQFWRSVTIDEMLGYLSDSIAPEHNQSTVYAVGDLVMHNKALWRCIQAGAGAFVNANWELVTVADLIAEAGKIDDVQVKTTGDYETVVENKIAKIDLSSVTAYGEVPNLPQAIATFKDGADAPLKELKVAIEPQQDLHGYDSPWVGGAGKNKFDQDSITEISSTTENRRNGQVFEGVGTFTVSASSNISSGNIIYSRLYSNGTYGTVTPIATDNSHTSQTYTLASGDKIIIFDASQHTIAESKTVFSQAKVQLESGSTATSYAPYSNICPISGWDEVDINVSGVNVCDEEWELGSLNNQGQEIPSASAIRLKNYIKCNPTQNFYVFSGSNKYLYIKTYDNNKNFISEINARNQAITIPNNAYYIRACLGAEYGTTYNNDISINYPSTDTSYHAYNGQTYEIDLDGTRYGGEVDVVNGVLTVDRAYVDLGTLNWFAGYGGFIVALNDIAPWTLNTQAPTTLICSAYPTMAYSVSTDMSLSRVASTTYIRIIDSRYTDPSAFKTAVNGVQLVYELATPLTIQLTPTQVKSLLGSNNIWADTGDINECVYRRDMSSTIDDIISRIEALEG